MANIFRVLGLPCITSDLLLNIDLIYSEGRTLSLKSNSFMWLRIIPRTGIEPVPLGEPDAGLAAPHLTACAQPAMSTPGPRTHSYHSLYLLF
jgi:hypothetical protein